MKPDFIRPPLLLDMPSVVVELTAFVFEECIVLIEPFPFHSLDNKLYSSFNIVNIQKTS